MQFTRFALLAAAWTFVLPAAVLEPSRVPYAFERNDGQAHHAVRFLARGNGYQLFLTEREAVLTLPRDRHTRHVLRMSLDGSRNPGSVRGLNPMPEASSYFVGASPNQWRTGVAHFGSVRYAGVYAGVDLVYHSSANRLEYDFVLAAGASVDSIKLHLEGISRLRVTSAGALELSLGAQRIVHQPPVAYQEIGGHRRPVEVAYRLLDGSRFGFRVGAYDAALPLVIDPVVIYTSFLGGDRSDTVHAVAVDPQGNTYVTGETTSSNFPLKGAGITKVQGAVSYAFVTKINAAGDTILYSAYLGGTSNTRGYAIAVDREGNTFLGGVTGSRNFPLVNPVQTAPPVFNIGYVAKLNAQGSALEFSTYIGGERNDEVRDLVLDPGGNIHVTGRATSAQFPTVNALQSTFGGSSDAFVAMYKVPDYRLVYSTFLGGAAAEEANALSVDSSGNTYVTGLAQGAGLATPGAYQSRVVSPNDAFVAKIGATGKVLEWLTYYGGRGDDKGMAIALDRSGNVLVGGSANSDNLVTTRGCLQAKLRGDSDAFLAKFSANGHELLYATYLGSSSTRTGVFESINRIALDALGGVTIAGVANGNDFPSVRPIQDYGGGNSDGFVARLTPSLAGIVFSTPIGGAADDSVFGMVLDAAAGVHVGGDTLSSNFPLKNPLQSNFAGARDGFVSRICDPMLLASSTRLELAYELGAASPADRTIQISACLAIPFRVESEGAFVAVKQAVPVTNGTVTVSFQTNGLQPGVHQAQLHLIAADAVNSPVLIPIVLKVTNPSPPSRAGN